MKIGKQIIPEKFFLFNDVDSKKLFVKVNKRVFIKLKIDNGTDISCDKPSSGKRLEIIDVINAKRYKDGILVTSEAQIKYKTEMKEFVINCQFFKVS